MAGGSREDKVALLLKQLPERVTATLLARLAPAHANRLRAVLQRIEQTPPAPEAMNQVLDDFDRLLEEIGGDSPANPDRTSPPTTPSRPASGAAPEPTKVADPTNPLAGLEDLPLDRLATALKNEHPRTVAVVLTYLEPTRAGPLLKALPAELRRPVSVQLGKPCTLKPELLQRIAKALAAKGQESRQPLTGPTGEAKYQRIADMLRMLDKAERADMIAALTEEDAETATRVKDLLYRFDDLLRIEPRSMQKLLAEIDSKALAVALKGAPETITEKVLANLSKRARESLTEEAELLGAVPPAQIAQAQKLVVEIIQRLDQSGDLLMT
jgi:flagellar motor switch protein FliG